MSGKWKARRFDTFSMCYGEMCWRNDTNCSNICKVESPQSGKRSNGFSMELMCHPSFKKLNLGVFLLNLKLDQSGTKRIV